MVRVGPSKKGENLVLNQNKQPLRILEIGQHFCIRVVKQARALMKREGYQVDAMTGQISYGLESFDKVYFFFSQFPDAMVGYRQYVTMLKSLKDQYDIFHIHNEPDQLILGAKEAGCYPIIYDVHDMDSVRQNIIPMAEVLAFRQSDAAVFVSYPCREWGVNLHKYKKPNTVLTHFCNEDIVDYPAGVDEHRHGIVYEGGANIPGEFQEGPFTYRGLYGICKQIVEMGNELHMFIGNVEAVGAYSDFGAHIYPPTPYPEMMKQLLQFKWGWCGFDNPSKSQRQVNMTMTNKMFEYIAAGLPVLVYGAEETGRFVESLEVGIVLKSLDELGNVEQNFGHLYPKLKENVERMRHELTMEKNIYLLENLYDEVLYGNTVEQIQRVQSPASDFYNSAKVLAQ